MEKEVFSNLLANSTSLTTEESNELVALSKDYPYCQVIHNLAARAAQDNALGSKEQLLTLSAIYSTDRVALKSLMTSPVRSRLQREVQITNLASSISPSSTVESESNDHLVEDLMTDLATMRESKRAFEAFIEKMESEKSTPLASVTPTKKESVEKKSVSTTESSDLIEEIKSTKKKIRLEGTKQIEQNEIIEQFIKTQPSITRKTVAQPSETNDLAEPSGHFGENIVSETLVEILLKQGKKEKAIEALKKLIWKFPQKKAYFAAQIEDLRK